MNFIRSNNVRCVQKYFYKWKIFRNFNKIYNFFSYKLPRKNLAETIIKQIQNNFHRQSNTIYNMNTHSIFDFIR